jgi:hypothetical protein
VLCVGVIYELFDNTVISVFKLQVCSIHKCYYFVMPNAVTQLLLVFGLSGNEVVEKQEAEEQCWHSLS